MKILKNKKIKINNNRLAVMQCADTIILIDKDKELVTRIFVPHPKKGEDATHFKIKNTLMTVSSFSLTVDETKIWKKTDVSVVIPKKDMPLLYLFSRISGMSTIVEEYSLKEYFSTIKIKKDKKSQEILKQIKNFIIEKEEKASSEYYNKNKLIFLEITY